MKIVFQMVYDDHNNLNTSFATTVMTCNILIKACASFPELFQTQDDDPKGKNHYTSPKVGAGPPQQYNAVSS
jgi:hypothetical protein